MNLMKGIGVVFLLLAGVSAWAEPVVSDIELLGAKVGENKYELTSAKEFTSDTSWSVGTTKISSVCKGFLNNDGSFKEFHITESQGQVASSADLKGGKLTFTLNGKKLVENQPSKWDGKGFLHPFHPKLAANFLKLAEESKGKPVKFFFAQNGLAELELPLVKTNSVALLGNGVAPVVGVETTLQGITLKLVFDQDGTLRGFGVPVQNFFITEHGWSGIFADPIAKYPELPKPTFTTKTETGLKFTTSDGATLVADVVRPTAEGKYPVILMRTPYGRAASILTAPMYARRGYAVVAQDVRGMGDSTGNWDPFMNEVADGKATLDWLVQQPWCDGTVGMIGGSYGGTVQWAAAVTHHPALKCIIPQVSPPDPVHNVPWDHGAFLLLGNVWWSRIVAQKEADMAAVAAGIGDLSQYAKLPISRVDNAVLGKNVPFFDQWVKRDTISEWPGVYRQDQIASVKIPVLHISGFWDGDGIGTKMHWEAQRQAGGNQWLVFGPWEHGFNVKTSVGGVDYGRQSVIDLDSLYLRFFETYLKGKEVKMEAQPRVRVFVGGSNQWYTGNDWPFSFTKRTTWYLGGGDARGPNSAGKLTAKPKDCKSDSLLYDPIKIGKRKNLAGGGSFYQKPSAFDNGNLTYFTEPFAKETLVTGPFEAELCVSTTAKDATFHAMLMDKHPDGKLQVLGLPGTQRLTYLSGEFVPLKPHQLVRFKIDIWDFAHAFKPGHQLVLLVTSDLYPKFARNPGTGERDETATRMVKATHTVYKVRGLSSKFSAQTYSW